MKSSTRNLILSIIAIAVLISVVYGGTFYYKNLRGAGPAVKSPPVDIVELFSTSSSPLTLPSGFSISIFAKDLPGVRVMAVDKRGNLWVSRTNEGIITMLDVENGKVIGQQDIFTELKNPHGLAFDPKNPDDLYIAQEDSLSHVVVYRLDMSEKESLSDIEEVTYSLALYSAQVPIKIASLPAGDRHVTRTIGFGPDTRLYAALGSSCNVCHESEQYLAKIISMNKDGSDMKIFASGLRNAVFFTWNPADKKMWATEMGRDGLGDDIPPDEINIVEEEKNYGWPICYGKNIHDDEFDKNVYIRNPCMEPFETPSHFDLPAHSAPLGLAFIPTNAGWPEEYENDLLIAYHGSWNRSEPAGYSVVRIPLDDLGHYDGVEAIGTPVIQNFITGWLTQDNEALGRPVDLLVLPEGILYISDDKAGVIYEVRISKSTLP